MSHINATEFYGIHYVTPPGSYPLRDYDGNIYTTVIIGDQEWIVENLKVTHYADGTPIPNVTDTDEWVNGVSNKSKYGALYNWWAASGAVEVTIVPTILQLVSQGDGSGIGVLQVTVSEEITLSVDGDSYFCNNLGVIDPTNPYSKTLTTGGYTITYIKTTSGTSNLTFSNRDSLIMFGSVTSSSGGFGSWAGYTADSPKLDCTNFDFPNCLEIYMGGSYLQNTISDFTELPLFVEKVYLSSTCSTAGNISGDLSEVPASCKILGVSSSNTITGDLSSLPSILEEVTMFGSNTVTGDVASIPSGVTTFQFGGVNTIYGDIADFPSGLLYCYITGSNIVTGDVANLPSTIIVLQLHGSNTIYGDIADLPSTESHFEIGGYNTLSGSLDDLKEILVYFYVYGSNTIGGTINSLPSNMYSFSLWGYNNATGDIANLPVSLTSFNIPGGDSPLITGDIISLNDINTLYNFVVNCENTIYGSITGLILPSISAFSLGGSNVVSGDLSSLYHCYELSLMGHNTVSIYSSVVWQTGMYHFMFYSYSGGLDSSEVDQLLIDLDVSPWNNIYVSRWLYILGTNAARTAASDVAVASLTAKGVAVGTN